MSTNPLVSIDLPPGIVQEGTVYATKRRWVDGSGFRFYQGTKQPIGGWSRLQDGAGTPVNIGVLTGIPRAMRAWSQDDGSAIVAIGSTNRFQVVTGRTLYDISPGVIPASNVAPWPPPGLVVTAGSLATSGATAGNATSIQIAATTYTGTYAVGDMLLIAGVLYTVTASTTVAANTALVPVTPAAPGGGIAGATPVVYYATIRRDSGGTAGAGGWGSGPYGVGAYGIGSTGTSIVPADTYQIDVFGQQGVFVCTVDKVLYAWTGTALATAAAGAPTCRAVVITPERYVTALFAQSVARRVMWADRESLTTWTAAANNTAGAFDLKTDGKLICGRRSKTETLLWTDCDLWAMRYIGGVFVYRFDQVGDHCGIIAPNAVVQTDTQTFWMGQNGFFMYDGYVHSLPSDIADGVFNTMNFAQKEKVWGMPFAEFNEVWWFYPAGTNATECNAVAVYNYAENHWSRHDLSRTAGYGLGAWAYPLLADSTGAIYEHESGNNRTGMTVFLKSGVYELGPGDQVMHVYSLVPDITSTSGVQDVSATFYTSMFPNDVNTASEVATTTTSASPTWTRLTAKQLRIKLSEVNAADWRVGSLRIGARPGGKR